MKAYAGEMRCPRVLVETKLRDAKFPLERLHIVEGFFDEETRKKDSLPERCSFAFVDFDLYKPVRDALAYLHTVLEPGGYVAVHDYGFFSSGAQKAVDQFLDAHPNGYEFSLPHDIAKGIAILRKTD